MPDPIQIEISAGNLPAGYCWPPNPQDYLTEIVSLLMAQIPAGFSLFSFGQTPGDPGLPWLRTDASGYIDGWYTFVGGDWVRPHPIAPSSPIRWLWMDTEANLVGFDGGNGSALTDRSGPFWVVDHNFDGRMPVGPNDAVTPAPTPLIHVNENGGAASVVLNASQVPDHRHLMPQWYNHSWFGPGSGEPPTFWDEGEGYLQLATTDSEPFTQGTQDLRKDNIKLYTHYNEAGTAPGTVNTAVNVMNPYLGAFVIRRTSRKYIVAT